jgi:cathepsin A (carboxypeptidase C)
VHTKISLGPGCSSLTGLFMELGPSTVNKAGNKPIRNQYSWNNNASVIFLDQPINVGYSYGDDSVSDTVAASQDVYALLVLFFKQFPEYKKLDFHIAGESYAGHYIPVFASGNFIAYYADSSDILSHQDSETSFFFSKMDEANAEELSHINLKSVLIGMHPLPPQALTLTGNGLTDGKTQYSQYANMACNNSYGPVLSDSECASMEAAYPRCAQLIQSCYDNQ